MPFVVRKAESARHAKNATAGRPPREPVAPVAYFRWVMLVSRIAGMILLVPALPAIIILVMLVEITSPGPGIYRQRRVGLRGKPFTLYKIRTMLRDAEARTGPVWTAPNDPRITKLGRLLRPLHLDELPQLFNVVMGQMTLIGPRPERPEFTQYLARQIPGYLDRFSVMPGITGLAQINLPPDTDLDSVRRKLVLDVEYIRTARLKLDMQIFFCTALRLIGVPGEAGAKLARVVREAPIPDWMRLEDAAESSPMTYHEPRSETLRPAVGVAQRLACEGDLPVA